MRPSRLSESLQRVNIVISLYLVQAVQVVQAVCRAYNRTGRKTLVLFLAALQKNAYICSVKVKFSPFYSHQHKLL
jgi:hypothetical protein